MRRVYGDVQHVRARGRWACFTRPEFRTERYSNVVGSTTAWEGLLSQVMGHRGVRYEIVSVAMLFYPRWSVHTVNEISDFGNGRQPIRTEDRRTLRTTALLAGNRRKIVCSSFDGSLRELESYAGVDYIVSFRVGAPDQGQLRTFRDMLDRRLRNGHFWRQPYLGIRELAAAVDPVTDLSSFPYPEDASFVEHKNGLRTANYSAPLGLSFYGIDWDDPKRPYYFAPLEVKRGVVEYPSWDEVRRMGIRREGARC